MSVNQGVWTSVLEKMEKGGDTWGVDTMEDIKTFQKLIHLLG